jgi:hypothetical protein
MPTPVVPNGKLRLSYVVASLTHIFDMRASINNPSAGSGYLLDLFGGGTIAWASAFGQVDALIGALFHSDASFGQWTLYLRDGSNYVPLDSGASAATGSNTLNNQAAGQLTLNFKDASNRLDKLVLLESSFLAPQKATSGTFLGAGTFMSDVINTASGHIGSWFQGRGGVVPTRKLSAVVTLNRRIRRDRSLA